MTGLNGRQRLVSAVLSVMQPREKYIKSSGEREERERNAGRRQEGTEDEGKRERMREDVKGATSL